MLSLLICPPTSKSAKAQRCRDARCACCGPGGGRPSGWRRGRAHPTLGFSSLAYSIVVQAAHRCAGSRDGRPEFAALRGTTRSFPPADLHSAGRCDSGSCGADERSTPTCWPGGFRRLCRLRLSHRSQMMRRTAIVAAVLLAALTGAASRPPPPLPPRCHSGHTQARLVSLPVLIHAPADLVPFNLQVPWPSWWMEIGSGRPSPQVRTGPSGATSVMLDRWPAHSCIC